MMPLQQRTYTRYDVVAFGFEARCVDAEGAHYLWHDDQGLRVDAHGAATMLITDPVRLPEGPWVLTELGSRELADGEVWR
jgi:hypothetical protein